MLQGVIGNAVHIGDGNTVNARMGRDNDLIVSQLHRSGFENASRGLSFGSSITGQVTTVGVATTYTGLCLSNPITSNVKIVLKQVGLAFLVAFAAASTVGIMTGFNGSTNVTHTTPAVVRNKLVNAAVNTTGTGLVDSASTLPTAPVLDTVLFAGLTGAITLAQADPAGLYDLLDGIVLMPGGYAAVYTSTVSGAASMSASFVWDEISLP